MYAWRPGLAVAVVLFGLAATVLLAWAAAHLPRAGRFDTGLYSLLVLLVLYVAVVYHAWRTARRAATQPRPTRWKLGAVLALFWAVMLLVGVPVRHWIKWNIMEAFRIPSGAMAPTVLEGDYLIVVPEHGPAPSLGALVTYRWSGTTLLKRVVGLAGDTLEMRNGTLYRNGLSVAESYAHAEVSLDSVAESDTDLAADLAWQRTTALIASKGGAAIAAYRPTLDTWGPLLVPTGAVFVLGDNRHGSLDSRILGFIPEGSVTGRAQYVYFSRDPRGGVRWERIGARLQ
jgi:signal peptidase I